MVSIAGGEPLVHPEVHVIAAELIKRKKYVFLCTNAILMKKRLDRFTPSPYFSWVVHLDGMRERHDQFVEREGIFDLAIEGIKEAKARGFRVSTNTTFLTTDTPQTIRDVLDYLNDELKVDSMQISPAYAYEKAPDQEHFPGVVQTRKLFSEAFADGNRKRWRLNHTPLFLDFLEGKVDFQCTPWGIPSYSIFGWQRPCYLMGDGYTETYKELIETTDWISTAAGRRPLCELHGPLRVRADRRAPLDGLSARVVARRRRPLNGRRSAPGRRLRLLGSAVNIEATLPRTPGLASGAFVFQGGEKMARPRATAAKATPARQPALDARQEP